MQNTILKKVSVKGIGLHSGAGTTLTLHPAPVNSGIKFWRSDLGENETGQLSPDRIFETQLCTGVKLKKEMLMTIEHLLSSMFSEKIDNLLVEVRGPELPIFDGSAAAYQVLLTEAGKDPQNQPRRIIEVTQPIYVSEGVEGTDNFKSATFIPADSFRVRFKVDSYKHPYLSGLPNSAYYDSAKDNYWEKVGRARTFGFLRDVIFMQERGLALGGALANAMVFDHEKIINAEGMRFADEVVKHKILDAIGDIYALGYQVKAEYQGFRSGHALNNKLLRELENNPKSWRWVEE